MNPRLFPALALSLSLIAPAHPETLTAARYADFDHYVFAVSWQTGFCQLKHDAGGQRPRPLPDECAARPEPAVKSGHLTVHGLWPSLPKSLAAAMPDATPAAREARWRKFGCAARPLNYPHIRPEDKCDAARLPLKPGIRARLDGDMPGARASTCLDRYEYAKHGACFQFEPNAYFATMLDLLAQIRASRIGEFMAANYGRTVEKDRLLQAIRSAYGPAAAESAVIDCGRNNGDAYLTEMQFALRKESVNRSLSPESFVPGGRADQGSCGKRFRVDAAGY